MKRIQIAVWVLFLAIIAQAQFGEAPIKIYGYYQAIFENQTSAELEKIVDGVEVDEELPVTTTFVLQHLNFLFKKDLAPKLSSFINLEFTNSFSSTRNWGNCDLEEVWVCYRRDQEMNLKLGMLIPTFNNLNDIKNRTPLLPYIERPLAYESSLSDVLPLDELTPEQAFVQVYGVQQFNSWKMDYALYVGNSSNVANQTGTQRGLDTTDSFLLGGRLGLRRGTVKTGFSVTHEKVNMFEPLTGRTGCPRIRLGFDFSHQCNKFTVELEGIYVHYFEEEEMLPGNRLHAPPGKLDWNKFFMYGFGGYNLTENLMIFGLYNSLNFNYLPFYEMNIYALSAGGAYRINDRMTVKAQHYNMIFDHGNKKEDELLSSYAIAVSVFF